MNSFFYSIILKEAANIAVKIKGTLTVKDGKRKNFLLRNSEIENKKALKF